MLATRLMLASLFLVFGLSAALTAAEEKTDADPPKFKNPALKDRLDRKPITLAKITVANGRRVPLAGEADWSNIPPYFETAEVYLRGEKRSPYLDLTAETDGDVIIAAAFKADGVLDEESQASAYTFADIIHDGWGHLHFMTHGKDEHYWIFHKTLKKGETVRFHTRAAGPPLVLIPDEKGRQHIAHITATDAIHESNNLKFPQRPQHGTNDHRSVLLNTHQTRSGSIYIDRKILTREIVRQAILLATREELQLKTRDAVLREKFPTNDAPTVLPVEFVSTVVPGHNMHVTLFHRVKKVNVDIWENYFELPGEKHRLVETLTAKCEGLARTEFVTALGLAGYSGQRNKQNLDATVPADVEDLLSQMAFVPQFSAVRQLHQLIREQGESPRLLGALARGYANLRVLTSWNYSGAHQVFAARSLLYAERMVVAEPDSADSYWERAYVRTLLGRHHTALEDLQQAEELADQTDAPPWVKILKAVCLYDEDQLEEVVNDPQYAHLTRVLRMIAGAGGSRQRTVREAALLLKELPDSYFAMVSLYVNSDSSVKHKLAKLGPRALVSGMYDRILAVLGLPAEVREIAEALKTKADAELEAEPKQGQDPEVLLSPERRGRLELIEALHKAGSVENDAGELS